jgi:hypothetical protein
MAKKGFGLVLLIISIACAFCFSMPCLALDVTHTINDYLVYDDYINTASSQNIAITPGSYTYDGTNWVGFRTKTNGRIAVRSGSSSAVIITNPYNSLTDDLVWTTISITGSGIARVQVRGADDDGNHENVASSTWTEWADVANNAAPDTIKNKQFIMLRIELGSGGYVSQISLKYNTTMKDHPRLLIDDVAELRQRCSAGSALSTQCQKLKEFANQSSHYSEGEWQTGISARAYALQYVLTGDEAYKNKARDELNRDLSSWSTSWSLLSLGPFGERMAITYDWIYNGLTDAERASIESKLISFEEYMNYQVYHHPEYNNHIYAEQSHVLLAGIAMYGGPNTQKAQGYMDIGYDYLFNHNIPATNQLFLGMGGWHESLGYFSGEMGDPIAYTLDGMRTATGVNFFEAAQGLRNLPNWYLYSTLPHDKSVIHLADNGKLHWATDLSSASSADKDAKSYLMAYAKNYRLLGYDTDAAYAQYIIDNLIGQYYQSDPGSLYRGGNVYDILWYDSTASKSNIPNQRLTGYAPVNGEVVMREGNNADDTTAMFHCADFYGGHQQADNGHFSIWYKGYLAVDSGYYDSWGSSHHFNYARRTVAHNTLTIYKPGETFSDTSKNDGGQSLNGDTGYYDVVQPGTQGDVCNITLDTEDDFDYINSDFTKSYAGGKVSLVTRQFVFFRPDKFVVFDRVNATDAAYLKKYLLHSQNDMAISGENISFSEGNGKLFSRTLLPQNPVITKVGGTGQEFTVQGTNYPISSDSASAAAPYAGKYRAEISPSVQNKFDNFLHVMQAADSGTASMAESQLLESSNTFGARIGDKVAVFSKTGAQLSQAQYSFTSTTSTQNIIVDLKPGYGYSIEDNGVNSGSYTANEEGLISFTLPAGSHSIAAHAGSLQQCSSVNGGQCLSGSCTSDYSGCSFALGYCSAGNCCSGSCTEIKDCIPYENQPCDGCYDNAEIRGIINTWLNSNTISHSNLMTYLAKWKAGCNSS